jgi:hypothetical protein
MLRAAILDARIGKNPVASRHDEHRNGDTRRHFQLRCNPGHTPPLPGVGIRVK